MRRQYRSTRHADSRSLIDVVRAVIQAISRGHQRRVAIRELEALDARTLRDIGLHRGQIGIVVDTLLNEAPPPSRKIVATHNAPVVAANDNEYSSVA